MTRPMTTPKITTSQSSFSPTMTTRFHPTDAPAAPVKFNNVTWVAIIIIILLIVVGIAGFFVILIRRRRQRCRYERLESQTIQMSDLLLRETDY